MSSRPSRGAARLAAILDALPDALLLVNANGTVVNANSIALEVFESPGTGLVGRGLLSLLPEFDSKLIPGSMRRPGDEEPGRTKPKRMTARRTDGSEFPVEVTSAGLEDGRDAYADQHRYTGDELLMLVVRDLSGTVDTEAELARSQRQTEMILRAAAEGVVGTDTDGRVVLANPAAAQILGYRATELGNRELHSLAIHSRADGSPFPYEESPLADTLRSGRKHRVRGQVLWNKAGQAVPVDLTTSPVRDGDQLVGAVMTFTDRRPYDALAARHAQLLAVLGDALRGPLEELRGELATLAADDAGQLWPEANQLLHHLAAGYSRMTTLVDNVLGFQRLDAGMEKLTKKKVLLDGVVAAGVEGAVELIGPGRAQFAVHAPTIEAEVDAGRLATALAHLVADVAGVDSTGNAPVAAGGYMDSTVVVAAAQRGKVVRIEVRGPYSGGNPVHEPIVRGIVAAHGGVLQTVEVPGAPGGAYVLEVPLGAGAGTVTLPDPEPEPAAPAEPKGKRARRGVDAFLEDEPPAPAEGGALELPSGRRRAPGAPAAASGPAELAQSPVNPAGLATGRRRGRAGDEAEAGPQLPALPAAGGDAVPAGGSGRRRALALSSGEPETPQDEPRGRRRALAPPQRPEPPQPVAPPGGFALPGGPSAAAPTPVPPAGVGPVPPSGVGPVPAAGVGPVPPNGVGPVPPNGAGPGTRVPAGYNTPRAEGAEGTNAPGAPVVPAGGVPVPPGLAVPGGPATPAVRNAGGQEAASAPQAPPAPVPPGAPVPPAGIPVPGASGPAGAPVPPGVPVPPGTPVPPGAPAPPGGGFALPPQQAAGTPATPAEGTPAPGVPVPGVAADGSPVPGIPVPTQPTAEAVEADRGAPVAAGAGQPSGRRARRALGSPNQESHGTAPAEDDHTPPQPHPLPEPGTAPAIGRRRALPATPAWPVPAARTAPEDADASGPVPLPGARQAQDTPAGPISVRTLGQGVALAQPATADTPAPVGTQDTGSGRRRRLAEQSEPGRAFAIGAPEAGAAEGPEPLDGPGGAVEVVNRPVPQPVDDELPPEPLDNPRRLLVWPAPDVQTQQALSDRGYRPVIVHSREEVDAQIAAFPAALFVDPLTGPITRTALQSLRQAAVAAEVPVLVTAGLGQATREAAYGADPAVLLKALAPRDSEQHPSRVLLIEEHDEIAGALAAALERRGLQVARAGADTDAVQLATQLRPNLVVMDLMQVRRRRAGIVDWLRANGQLNRTPLVVYTSVGIDKDDLSGLVSGETVLFLAERSTAAEVQGRIVDLLAKIGTN
ncbi:PAS domain-containing protein [Streptomyces sp. NPDC086023]|uniref:response regulator n=1 Tax=Streptomyces sp. NPDC086023 TaxID=3365746 RepID=UPI0037D4BCCE